jgi:hypothetical protein
MANSKNYPYHNTDLANLRGETWKDIPDFEGLYEISSHGRVKSLPRYINNYWKKERIRKIKVHKLWNAAIGVAYFECTLSLFPGNGVEITCIVHRLVYNAFVKHIDWDADRLQIMHKDGDGLNNHYSNLVAGTRHDVLKTSYRRKRHISPFALKTEKEFKEIGRWAGITRQKKIVQYSIKGNRMRVFNSIKEASARTGIVVPNLGNVLKGGKLTTGNFIWRYYPGRKKISVRDILKRKGLAMQR